MPIKTQSYVYLFLSYVDDTTLQIDIHVILPFVHEY